MDALAGYGSDSSDDSAASRGAAKKARTTTLVRKAGVTAAPRTGLQATIIPDYVPTTLAVVKTNPTAAELYAPMSGPARPFPSRRVEPGSGHVLTGRVEREDLEDFAFDEQYNTFMSFKFAADPSRANTFVGNHANYMAAGQATVYTGAGVKQSPSAVGGGFGPPPRRKRKRGDRRRELQKMDLGSDDIWAPVPEDEDKKTALEKGELTEGMKKVREEMGLDKDEEGSDESGSDSDAGAAADGTAKKAAKAKKKASKDGQKVEEDESKGEGEEDELAMAATDGRRARDDPPRVGKGVRVKDCHSKFHGKSMLDYQGRSFIEPPRGLRPDDDHTCYIPKKCIHKYTGHNGGVNSIEFFPKFGHLLLSGSADTKVKLWDVYNHRNCKRTYFGHDASVRHVTFNDDGSRFLSSAWDRHVKLWDTETGKCIHSFTNGKVPYQSKFRPGDNNSFLSACSSKEIAQYDIREGKQEFTYDYHLAAVNTITFVEGGNRFVSTSDDKKMLVWEWNTNVPIKWISEPTMHSMPAVTIHPSGKYFGCQSMDNNVVVYGVANKFRPTKKKFTGHNVAGYACQVGFSPDGKFTMSGDGNGRLFFWDWRTTKVYRKLRAHNKGPCFGSIWHPIEPSCVATCGWDGLIKLWD